MRIESRMSGTTCEVRFGDRMTFSDHTAFRALLKEITKSGAKACVFDLHDLQAIDSAGLGMFMIALDEAKKSGWTLRLKSPQGPVKSLLELGRFDKLMSIEA